MMVRVLIWTVVAVAVTSTQTPVLNPTYSAEQEKGDSVGELHQFEGHTGGVHSVTFFYDDRRALSGSEDNTVRVWDVETGKELRRFDAQTMVFSVAISSDGRRAIFGGSDHSVRVWDVEAGKELRRFDGHTDLVSSVAIDGRRALTGSWDKTMLLWDVESGKVLRRFEGHESQIQSVALSGQRALSSGGFIDDESQLVDCAVRLWDVETGKVLHRFQGHKNRVNSVAISSDGRRALSGSADCTVRLWDLEEGKELRVFKGHETGVLSVAYSSDGRRALSSGGSFTSGAVPTDLVPFDCVVRLWDVETGKELHRFEGHKEQVNCVTFSHDGRLALSGGGFYGTVRLWGLPKR